MRYEVYGQRALGNRRSNELNEEIPSCFLEETALQLALKHRQQLWGKFWFLNYLLDFLLLFKIT